MSNPYDTGTDPDVPPRTFESAVYPIHCISDGSLLKRCEAPLTPKLLVSRFLLGIPLKHGFEDPEVQKDRINMAINDVEMFLKAPIYPEKFKQKLPYDSSFYRSFIHFLVEHRPITEIWSVGITSADGQSIYTVPPRWIETANAMQGQINVIPLLSTFGASGAQGNVIQNAGLVFIATLGQLTWLPAFWQVEYVSGLSTKEGQVPIVVNNLIGVTAAIDMLSNMASLNTNTSVSLGQDGISQSTSSPGPQVYVQRITDLEAKRTKYIKEIKSLYGNSILFGNI